MIDDVHTLLERYRSKDFVCPIGAANSFACGSFLLGALSKELDKHTLFLPRPEVPFNDLSFDDICGNLRAIESPAWATPNNNNGYYGYSKHGCNLSTAMQKIIADAGVAVVGLELEKMKNSFGGSS